MISKIPLHTFLFVVLFKCEYCQATHAIKISETHFQFCERIENSDELSSARLGWISQTGILNVLCDDLSLCF